MTYTPKFKIGDIVQSKRGGSQGEIIIGRIEYIQLITGEDFVETSPFRDSQKTTFNRGIFYKVIGRGAVIKEDELSAYTGKVD